MSKDHVNNIIGGLDRNLDGKLNLAEVRGWRNGSIDEDQMRSHFSAMDTNQDGFISAVEIDNDY